METKYFTGELEIEFCPQGTLAERLRAGGAGIPAFYTPTGFDTPVQYATVPLSYSQGLVSTVCYPVLTFQPCAFPKPRETRKFGGRDFMMEEAIIGDVAFIRAWKVDEVGNAVFRYTANNFSGAMARSAKVTIVEVSAMFVLTRAF